LSDFYNAHHACHFARGYMHFFITFSTIHICNLFVVLYGTLYLEIAFFCSIGRRFSTSLYGTLVATLLARVPSYICHGYMCMEKILHHCGICSQYLLPPYVHLPEPHGLTMLFWCRVAWNVSTHFGRNIGAVFSFFLAFFR
jgi:hypothetical protein